MMNSNKNLTIKKLTEREHIIHRPSMYIGSVSEEEHEDLVFDIQNKIPPATKKLNYSPGLVKIINEVIDNSVDAIIKTNQGNKISVDIKDNRVSVIDNSSGFPAPTNLNDDPSQIPVVLALGNARAGSNFDDDDNLGQMGTNGVGAFCTNCFSTKFECISYNSGIKVHAKWENNAELKDVKVSKVKTMKGTEISFTPDLTKFNMQDLDSSDVLEVIKSRLVTLSLTYPEINFFFNGVKVRTPKRLKDMFVQDQPYVDYKSDNWEVLVIANQEKVSNFSVVNGLNTSEGGTHIDIIYNEIQKELTNTKGLNCNRQDILNTLQIVFVAKGWKNLKFNSQTKEKITNSVKDTREFLGNLDELVIKVKQSKSIKDFIKATTQARELRNDKRAIKKAKRTRIKSTKFLDAQGDREILMLVEGDSAMGGLVPALGRQGIAYYALKGKPLNSWRSSTQKVAANQELSELLAIIHQNDFKKIVIGTDQDLDGFHIRGLLLGFIYKLLPELKDRIYFLNTPVRGITKNGKLVRWSYNLEDELNLKSSERAQYYKGLGSWDPEDFQIVLKKDGLGKIIQKVDIEEESETMLEAWLGNDSQLRKELIYKNDFSIAKL